MEKIKAEKAQKKFRDQAKLLQSWDVEKKMKLLEKQANERGDRTYHKIVYAGRAAPDDLLS